MEFVVFCYPVLVKIFLIRRFSFISEMMRAALKSTIIVPLYHYLIHLIVIMCYCITDQDSLNVPQRLNFRHPCLVFDIREKALIFLHLI